MRKITLTLFLICLPLTAWAEGTTIGRLVNVRGEVVKLAAPEVPLKKGDRLYQGDKLQSSKGGYAKILMKDDTLFQLGPQSQMHFEKFVFTNKKKRTAIYNLLKGKLRSLFTIKNFEKKGIQIKTPNTAMAVRGTEILSDVYMQGGEIKTDIALVSGRLEIDYSLLKFKDQSETILEPGQMISFARVPGPHTPDIKKPIVTQLSQKVMERVTQKGREGEIFLLNALEKEGVIKKPKKERQWRQKKSTTGEGEKRFDFDLPMDDLSIEQKERDRVARLKREKKIVIADEKSIIQKIEEKGQRKPGKVAHLMSGLIDQKMATLSGDQEKALPMGKVWEEIKKESKKIAAKDRKAAAVTLISEKKKLDTVLDEINLLQNKFYKKLDEGTLSTTDKTQFSDRMVELKKEKNIQTDRVSKAKEYLGLMTKWQKVAVEDPGSYAIQRAGIEQSMSEGKLKVGETLRGVDQAFRLAGGDNLKQDLADLEGTIGELKIRPDMTADPVYGLYGQDMTELTFKRDFSYGEPSFEFEADKIQGPQEGGRVPASRAGGVSSNSRTPASLMAGASPEEAGKIEKTDNSQFGRASREVQKINRNYVIEEAEEKARIIARSIAEGAAEKAAFEAAEKVALPAALKVAGKAANIEARKAAQDAAEKAAQKAASQAAESVAYTTTEGALRSEVEQREAREAVKKAARQAAKLAAGEAAGSAARRAAEDAARESAIGVARKAAIRAANRAALDAVQTAMERITAESGWGPDDLEAKRAAKLAALKVAKQAAEVAADKAAVIAASMAAEEAARIVAEEAAHAAAEIAARSVARKAADIAARKVSKTAADKSAGKAAEKARFLASKEAEKKAQESTERENTRRQFRRRRRPPPFPDPSGAGGPPP